MQVIDFIRNNSVTHDLREGLEKLTIQLGISVKYVDDLIVLNYNQIDSPKTHPIVMECRSLILEASTLNVVSRSFDRFFNYGEALNVMPVIDWNKAVAYEKVDGSLIKIYNYKDHWYISTKGTAYGESDCMGYGITFAELVYKALGCKDDEEFQRIMRRSTMCQLTTYIFELTSVENRVVKRYEGYTLHYLSSRHNQTGEFGDNYEKQAALMIGAKEIKEFKFDCVESCLNAAKGLPDLEEGYVVYQDGIPVCKIKSPAYLAVHAIRGEGLTPKRIMQLVLMNEQDEYLSYFPEDEEFFNPYVEGLENLLIDIATVYDRFEGIVEQKEFALCVKDYSFSAVMFQARQKNQNPVHTFHEQTETYKMKVLEQFV